MIIEDFDGLKAIVTGGSSGIGLATAKMLISRGAHVIVLDLLEPVKEDILYERADISDGASVVPAFEAATRRLGGLDILINNAGIGAQGTIEETPDDEWRQIFEVNVLGIVRCSRAALPALRDSATGTIVNTCSVAATAGLVRRAAYSASKGAVLALTRAMAADYLREGIRVNCVNPGTVDTPWVARLLDASPDPNMERDALVARQPHRRLVAAEEVAAAIAYLASPLAGSTTGTAIEVDGGMAGLRIPLGRT